MKHIPPIQGILQRQPFKRLPWVMPAPATLAVCSPTMIDIDWSMPLQHGDGRINLSVGKA